VTPEVLQHWLGRGHDDQGRRVVMLDTRNREEVGYGSFIDAITLPIDNFVDLPAAVTRVREQLADATVVPFCTGGIRCEKAALWMQSVGIDHVFQLQGGILGYFERVGGDHYRGDCFVFDQRIALDQHLNPSGPARDQDPACSQVEVSTVFHEPIPDEMRTTCRTANGKR
jgi:UPF0176 protein